MTDEVLVLGHAEGASMHLDAACSHRSAHAHAHAYARPRPRPRHMATSCAGQIGCYLSHYGVYKAARTAGLRSFLVLEDDAVLRPSAGKRFRQAARYRYR